MDEGLQPSESGPSTRHDQTLFTLVAFNHEYKVAKKKKVPILDLTASVQDVCRSSIIKILKDRKMPDWTRLDLK